MHDCLAAGHETTGATLSRILPFLQKQPDILQRMREEQAAVVQRFGQEITCETALLLCSINSWSGQVFSSHLPTGARCQ